MSSLVQAVMVPGAASLGFGRTSASAASATDPTAYLNDLGPDRAAASRRFMASPLFVWSVCLVCSAGLFGRRARAGSRRSIAMICVGMINATLDHVSGRRCLKGASRRRLMMAADEQIEECDDDLDRDQDHHDDLEPERA